MMGRVEREMRESDSVVGEAEMKIILEDELLTPI